MRFTIHSRTPAFTGSKGEFLHPTKKIKVTATTISCTRLPNGKYEIIAEVSDDPMDLLNTLFGVKL